MRKWAMKTKIVCYANKAMSSRCLAGKKRYGSIGRVKMPSKVEENWLLLTENNIKQTVKEVRNHIIYR